MDITSRVTTGKDWADCKNTIPPSEVIIVSSEDAPEDTLKPRLMAAGADELKYFFVETTQVGDGENATEKIFSIDTDLPALRATLTEHPEVKLIVIDPVMNHLGDVNGNKEQELRQALTPLGLLAQEFDVAIILVAHFNKKVDAEVIQRVGGAMALVGCVRAAWTFTESQDGEGVRLMLSAKQNLSNAGGISFEIETVPVLIENEQVDVARVKWGEESLPAKGAC
jgi:putative DNA primase/helicase